MPSEEILAGLDKAASVIAAADTIVATCHIGPDGDALGSALALALSARDQGKLAVATFGGPFVVADHFAFLDVSTLVPPSEVPAAPDVVVSFDAGSADRLGEVAATLDTASCVIVIDHHASNTGFGDINVNDAGAGASAQLCFYLLERLGWPLTPASATALLAGVVTDTGRFQYSNTSADVLRVAADLVEAGARPEEIGQNVYESVPFGYLRVESTVLARAVLEAERRFIWSVLLQEDMADNGIGIEDTDPLIDAVRVAREADVAALAKEQPDGSTKVSLRSRGRVDVGAIAESLGGGGHHNAAGFTHPGRPEYEIDEVRKRL